VSTSPQRLPDWFDALWETHREKVPLFLRNDTGKKLLRDALGAAMQGAASYSTTPSGIRAIIAFSRISAIVKGVNGVCDAPDPSPEQVAEAVERLMKRVKP